MKDKLQLKEWQVICKSTYCGM